MILSGMIYYFHMPLKLKDMIHWLMDFLAKIVKRCYKEINREGEDPNFLVHVQSNGLLPDEQTLKHSQDQSVNLKLVRNYNQYMALLENYRDMSEKCITAFENGNLYEIEKLY